MNNLITVFIDRQHDLFTALIQHLELSVSSLCLAILIAFPLGLFISRKPRMAAVITQLTGIMQTLPSLAILGLMIPVFGIGPIPALVALVIYALSHARHYVRCAYSRRYDYRYGYLSRPYRRRRTRFLHSSRH